MPANSERISPTTHPQNHSSPPLHFPSRFSPGNPLVLNTDSLANVSTADSAVVVYLVGSLVLEFLPTSPAIDAQRWRSLRLAPRCRNSLYTTCSSLPATSPLTPLPVFQPKQFCLFL